MAILGLFGTKSGLEGITRPHDRSADITVRDVIDGLAGMDIAQMRADRVENLAGLFKIRRIHAGAVTPHIGDHIRQHIGRRVQDSHTAILKLGGILRIKDQ